MECTNSVINSTRTPRTYILKEGRNAYLGAIDDFKGPSRMCRRSRWRDDQREMDFSSNKSSEARERHSLIPL
ncbi:Uncharacterized protein APZ42_022258 [Daphnia magna]|uniref:Uncharacterized protein n=1 Tax=Daphnia magna TaxID=35525 RepID=A0A164W645_9CRUS|nr:Uncharacterized protein APZ42_022258 [Daphnia magna]